MNAKASPPPNKSASGSYRAKLPVLPVSASQLLALDKNGTDYYEEVLELASKDPVIAAQIIKLSNSAAQGGRAEIETLHQAVARIGIDQVSSLITLISLSKIFTPSTQFHRNLWIHALQVAVASRKLAHLNRINTEQSYLTGLLHEIGRFILLMDDLDKFNALEAYPTANQALMIKEQEIFGHTSAAITIALLHSWNIPEPITQAISRHLKPATEAHQPLNKFTQEAPSVTLFDVLSVADDLSLLALKKPEIVAMDETDIEPLVREILTKTKSHGLFAAPAFLAKSLPGIIEEAADLASSLGLS